MAYSKSFGAFSKNSDKFSMKAFREDIFWLKDKSLTDLDNLPDPDELAIEIVDDLQAALDQFSGIINTLGVKNIANK